MTEVRAISVGLGRTVWTHTLREELSVTVTDSAASSIKGTNIPDIQSVDRMKKPTSVNATWTLRAVFSRRRSPSITMGHAQVRVLACCRLFFYFLECKSKFREVQTS